MKISADLLKQNLVNIANNSTKIISEISKLTSSNNKFDKVDKKENFKDVLDTKAKNYKSTESSNEPKDIKKEIEGIKKEIEELEEKNDEPSKDVMIELLNKLLNILNKIDGTQKLEESASNKLTDLISKFTELLDKNTSKDMFDSDSLKLIEKLLTKLNSKLDENINSNKDAKNLLNNLIADISKKVDSSENKTSSEEMLNQNNSNNNTEGSSKEDKFLNKLLNKDDSFDKMNLFTMRNQIHAQPVNNVQVNTTPINSMTFAGDLIQNVKYMVNNVLKELTVKINPQNLGQMTISLLEENGVMKANLKATSRETVELLAQNLGDIKKQLADQNIKIAEVNIELYQDDTTFFKQKDFGSEMDRQQNEQLKTSEGNKIEGILEDESVEEDDSIIDSNINFLA